MLNTRYNLKGMTLVELMVAVVIVFILLAAAMPNFADWIQNSKIRTAAESIQNGITLARTEAVHRNTTAQFVSCGGSTWDVIVPSAVAASSTVCASPANNAGWASIQMRTAESGSNSILIDPKTIAIGFNGMGRQASTIDPIINSAVVPAAVDINVSVSGKVAGAKCFCSAGSCGYPGAIPNAADGKLRCLRISVSPGGQVRMCDPALGKDTPQGC